MPVKLQIVIPVLNDARALAACLGNLKTLRQQGATVVVVDGGSRDDTWVLANVHADGVVLASRGRANQMNAGAAVQAVAPSGAASGDFSYDVLLFLHADTVLPQNAIELITTALQAGYLWGRFDVRFIPAGHLNWIATLMNLRSAWTGIATGDQAMFVRRDVFDSLGGFTNQPLMEDIELSARLRRLGWPARIREPVGTSARRWDQSGVWPTILFMWRLRLAYFLGADPHDLALQYGYRPATSPATACLAILAKAPIAGLAKTRLAPLLGARGAARFQRRLTLDTLHTARQAGMQEIDLWCAPDTNHLFFQSLRRTQGVRCRLQPAGDLGARMRLAFAQHFEQMPSQPLLMIGTDCVVLAPSHLQEAAQALKAHDVVLIPAVDGGYVLIGMRRFIPEVFDDIAWSTSSVLGQTRDRLTTAQASWIELAPLWDVDEPVDWQRWKSLIELPLPEPSDQAVRTK